MAGSKKVLIVEDNPIISMLEEKLLKQLGHEVLSVVESGEEAVEAFKELSPDFIIMDIALSGLIDGLEATKKIRETSSEVPIIFVTGNSDRFEKSNLEVDDKNKLVTKPFTDNDLADSIRSIFRNDGQEER